MYNNITNTRLISNLCASIIVGFVVNNANAGDIENIYNSQSYTSHWKNDIINASLSSAKVANGESIGIMKIKLSDGWKTYWHSPGETGIAPEFDSSTSQNVSARTLAFPIPKRFGDEYSTSVGYKKEVSFIFALDVKDKNKPYVWSMHARLGICKDICTAQDIDLSLLVKDPKNEPEMKEAYSFPNPFHKNKILSFKVKKEDDYANIYLTIKTADKMAKDFDLFSYNLNDKQSFYDIPKLISKDDKTNTSTWKIETDSESVERILYTCKIELLLVNNKKQYLLFF